MRRREEEGEPSRRSARHRASPSPARGEENEEAIRNKLRESGWTKRRTESESAADAESPKDKNVAKEMDEKGVSRGGDDHKSSRTSRSSWRSRSPHRRDREHRSSRRKASGSRRRSPSRSRSVASRSRSRSPSRSTGRRRHRHSSSLRKRRSSRSLSRGRDGKRVPRSRSTSVSKKKSLVTLKSDDDKKKKDDKMMMMMTTKRKKMNDDEEEDEDDDGDEEMEDEEEEEKTMKHADKKRGKTKDAMEESEKETNARHRHASSKKSSRRSRSGSPRSPSKSSRRRHHRRNSSYSRSRSPPRSRRARRGGSRSRSTPRDRHSRGRNRDRRSRRRGRSYSRSRSPSYSRGHRRLERSRSRDQPPRDANSSPEAHQHPPVSTDAAPVSVGTVPPAISTGVNPTITQLMAQYPTMSLQDIIAKMQASNVTMAAAVAQKPARELYVGNLPPNVTGPQLQEFLSTIIQQVGLTTQPGNPIVNTWISTDGHFAFCEMRSVEECNLALLLNQLSLLGQPLKFGRPRSFMGPPQPMPQISARTQTALTNLGCTPNPAWFAQPSISSITEATPELPTLLASTVAVDFNPAVTATTVVNAGSCHLIMSNIPVVLAEDQVKELVEPFGALKSFTLVKDAATGASMGSAVFEYEDQGAAAQALEGLNGLSIGGILLSVQRQPVASGVALGALPRAVPNPEDQPSAVLKMANMVSVDELRDDEEYADLTEDVEEECKRFGNVTSLEIPRPKDEEKVPGLGCIYVRFGKEEDAASAMKALNGRKFGGNIVKVSYFPVNKFEKREFS